MLHIQHHPPVCSLPHVRHFLLRPWLVTTSIFYQSLSPKTAAFRSSAWVFLTQINLVSSNSPETYTLWCLSPADST